MYDGTICVSTGPKHEEKTVACGTYIQKIQKLITLVCHRIPSHITHKLTVIESPSDIKHVDPQNLAMGKRIIIVSNIA